MTSLLLEPDVVPLGAQEPRVCSSPDGWVSSAAQEVIDLAESAGLHLDGWQRFILDVCLRERADGKWCSREVAYLVARQNGKGGVLEALALGALFLFDDETEILFSAHEFKTAKKAYRQLKRRIQNAPHLFAEVERRGSQVVGFRQSNEDTSITLQNGDVIRFMARSNNTGRGFSSQRLIVDEAQECSEETRQALQYIVSAQPNPQIIFTGTVPGPRNNGEVFTALRDRGRRGGDPVLSWMEWTPDPDMDLSSDAAVVQTNPAYPHRVTPETIVAERAAATTDEALDGLARERFSLWPDDDAASRLFDMAKWAHLGEIPKEDQRPSPVTFAVAGSQDRQWFHIGLAGLRSDGKRHLQVIRSFRGTADVVAELEKLIAEWKPVGVAVNPGGPAGSLIADLQAKSIEPVLVTGRDEGQAVGMFRDGFEDGSICHQGETVLGMAVEHAKLKDSGQSKVWDYRGDIDVAPLQAVTSALFALSTVKPKRAGQFRGVGRR